MELRAPRIRQHALGPEWDIIQGNWADYQGGMRSFHEKYWWVGGDQKLTNKLNQVIGGMRGFWSAHAR